MRIGFSIYSPDSQIPPKVEFDVKDEASAKEIFTTLVSEVNLKENEEMTIFLDKSLANQTIKIKASKVDRNAAEEIEKSVQQLYNMSMAQFINRTSNSYAMITRNEI